MHVNIRMCVCAYIHVSVSRTYSFVSNQQNMLEGICTHKHKHARGYTCRHTDMYKQTSLELLRHIA